MAACLGQAQLEHSAPTFACVSVTIRPLPKRPQPLQDELLSSWITRLASANHCSVPELCAYLGLVGECPPEMWNELAGVNIERLGAISGVLPNDMHRMLLARRADFPVECISRSDFQYCPMCRNAWSIVCKTCCTELLPLRADPNAGDLISLGLRTRASKGAGQLKQAYRQANRHAGRRIDLTMQIIGFLSPELRHPTLFSIDVRWRLMMLEAIHHGLSHPILAVAHAVRKDPAAGTRLHNAFPYKRKLLARVMRLAVSLPNYQSREVERKNDQSSPYKSARPNVARPEYLVEAKQAISQLGENAERSDLLMCAEKFLATARLQSVDIS